MAKADASPPSPDAGGSVPRSGGLPRFGVFLPAYVLPDAPPPSGHALAAYARHAEAVGFSSLWVFDHLLMTPDPRQLDLFATRIKPHLRLRAA